MKTGKSTLPPMGTAVKLQLRVFLLSEGRKTGKGLYCHWLIRETFDLSRFYRDLILFHPIVTDTCPPFILWNKPQPMTRQQAKEGKKRIRNRIEILPPDVPAAYPQFPVFLLSERMKTGKSTLPPMGIAVKLQLPVFLLSRGGKLERGFTADVSGGKAATAEFPPLRAEENWKMQFYCR
ncbi:hypothetical protein AAC387_Pa09g0467 [Persea americana]